MQKFKAKPWKKPKEVIGTLTERETQVASLIARDMKNQDIGKTLEISVETVKEHVQNILRKMKETIGPSGALISTRVGIAQWYVAVTGDLAKVAE